MEKEKKHQRTHVPVEGYEVEDLKLPDLENSVKIVNECEIENPREFRRQKLIFEILKVQTKKGGFVLFTGILELSPNGYGFLRDVNANLSDSVNDAYVSNSQIRRSALRVGDTVTGQARKSKDQEKYCALLKIEAINYLPLKKTEERPLFDNPTPIFPIEKIRLEYDAMKLTGRVLDLFTPIGKGQRDLIVAPPRTGKTEPMKELATAIVKNHLEMHLIVLLANERPGEITDIQRCVKGEVFSSTLDLPAYSHVCVAELVIEKAKRMVEMGKDIIILLDSITRPARTYNIATPSSGKVLGGGVDANALYKPKRFFGAARNIENGGSLTIIATALIDTGSGMDEMIFEEFKGTGNSKIVLDRNISDRRVYPAISVIESSTRKEKLLQGVTNLQKIWMTHSAISQMDDVKALKFLYSKMLKIKDNTELLSIMNE